jgi:hypothetical protein
MSAGIPSFQKPLTPRGPDAGNQMTIDMILAQA